MLPDALWQERVAGVRETYGTLIDTVALASRASRVLHYRLCLLWRLSGITRAVRRALAGVAATVDRTVKRPLGGTRSSMRDVLEQVRLPAAGT
jgi:hypothetical protein